MGQQIYERYGFSDGQRVRDVRCNWTGIVRIRPEGRAFVQWSESCVNMEDEIGTHNLMHLEKIEEM